MERYRKTEIGLVFYARCCSWQRKPLTFTDIIEALKKEFPDHPPEHFEFTPCGDDHIIVILQFQYRQ